MSSNYPAKFIGIILAFVLCGISTLLITSISIQHIERKVIVLDATNFLDSVVDSRTISDTQLKALDAKLASYSMLVTYEIYRDECIIDSTGKAGESIVYYVRNDDTSKFKKGDHVSIRLYTLGSSSGLALFPQFANLLSLDITFTARVR